jgi:hypothetical protein
MEMLFNTEMLERLVPVFEVLTEKGFLGEKVLDMLWNRAVTAHTSEKPAIVRILIHNLLALERPKATQFLSQFLKTSPFSPEATQFLVAVMKKNELNQEFDLPRVLFEESRRNEFCRSFLESELASDLHDAVHAEWVRLCLEEVRADRDNHALVRALLPVLVQRSPAASLFWRTEYDTFESAILDAIEYDRSLILGAFASVQICAGRLLMPAQIDRLVSNPDDELWSTFITLLENAGTAAATSEGFARIVAIVDRYDFRLATPEFVRFLKSLLLVLNYREGVLVPTITIDPPPTVVPSHFYLNKFPAVGVSYLFRLLETTSNQNVAQSAHSCLLTFVTTYQKPDFCAMNDLVKSEYLPVIKEKPAPIKARFLMSLLEAIVRLERNIDISD